MPSFKRMKIRAIVESPTLLLSEEGVEMAVAELRDKLTQLDLAVLSVEAEEPPAVSHEASADDPWSIRGQPVD